MIAGTAFPGTLDAAPESPYKLLDSFTDSDEDRRRFGGRDREIHELVTRITNRRTLVVYGPSGIGKTSLLRAGVFPALKERAYQPVYVRLFDSPVAELCREVLTARGLDGPGPGETLRDTLARAAQAGPLALVLDQFEELFVRFRAEAEKRRAFLSALAGVIQDRQLDVTVVLSLRQDYLASLDELKTWLPADLLADRYLVPPLTPFGVRQAVSRPLADAGVGYEPAVISGLISELGEVGFEPVQLQIVCSELYKAAVRRTGGGVPRLTIEDLKGLGGLDGVFRRYLQGVAEELPLERRLLARMVLDALITAEGTKRVARLADLLRSRFSAAEGEVAWILTWLVEHRLLGKEERNGEIWYELVHERLVPLLREWLDLDADFARFRQARSLVASTSALDLWRQSPDTLLSAETLANVLHPCREHFRFSSRELELVVRSAIFRQSEELSFWAERYGEEPTRGLVLEMLQSARDEERLAAVVSARRLDDPEGALAGACLRRALEDPREDVRLNAGLSLAKLARPKEIQVLLAARQGPDLGQRIKAAFQALLAALRNPDQGDPISAVRAALTAWQGGEQGERVSTTLAALAAGGNDLSGASGWERFWARYQKRKWDLRDQKEVISARTWLGLWSGLFAGLLWAAARLAVYAVFSPWQSPEPPNYWQWFRDLAQSLLHGIPHWILLGGEFLAIGALVGALTACAAARQAVIEKQEGRWVKALCRHPLFLGAWLLLAVLAGLAIAGKEGRANPWILAVWAVLFFVPVAVAQYSRPFVGLGSSPAGTWLGSLLISLGLPTLVALGAVFGTRKLWRMDFLAGRAGMTVASMAFFSFVISVALVKSAARYPVAGVTETARKKPFPIAVTLLAFLAVVAVVKGQYEGVERLSKGLRTLAERPPVEVSPLTDSVKDWFSDSRTAGSGKS